MEDDDEFGDLYTDVLTAFPSSSTAPAPTPAHAASPSPVDINLQSDVPDAIADDSNPKDHPEVACKIPGSNSVATEIRVLGSNLNLAADNDGEDKHDADFGNDFGNMEDLGSEPIIPGLATENLYGTGGGEGDDWDSDSDDDLQIVLNDNDHGHMSLDANGMIIPSNDDDQDGVIVDNDAGNQPAEEQLWGEEQSQGVDGKEIYDANKANGGLIVAPKSAYSNNGYHPFHSQFKYIRPGAAPLPGGPPVSSGGGLGDVRPSVHMGNMVGRGRGDWRSPGMKGPPMQKGFQPGFWGGNVQGRGLEFTLPSHKTVFEVDIDSFEEKTWKYPGVDVSDFFNFGLNEESWKDYCKQLGQLRLESTMQSKIRVYESGRAEQEYDPDLPPELAAAAGIYDTVENVDISKVQAEAGNLTKSSVHVRPPLPIGRSIQVETGCGERLPSVDTRPPRMRDSDAVIEIVLQDSTDETKVGDGDTENAKVGVVNEDDPQDEDEYFNGYSRGHSRMDDGVFRERSPIMNPVHDDIQDENRVKAVSQRASSDHPSSGSHAPSKDAGSPNEERGTKEKVRSPHMSSGDSALDRSPDHHHHEDSIDSMEGKHSVESSFDHAEGTQMLSLETPQDSEVDVPSGENTAKLNKDIDSVTSDNTSNDKLQTDSSKPEKSSLQVEPREIKEVNDGGVFKASRIRDNSKVAGRSVDRSKWHEGVEDETMEDGRSTYSGDLKRSHGEGGRDSRRNYIPQKGRDEYHSHRDWDPYDADHFHQKGEGTDKRQERDYSDVNWQRREEEPHSRRIRAVDTRKQERGDVTLLRDNFKVREVDRRDKDEYLNSRKSTDNGSWRGYHEKDAGLRYRDKDDSSRSRHDVLDDRHMKKRKDDEHLRRDYDKRDEIMLESSSTRRKRDRDDISNQWKKDDQNSSRHKDEVWMQREKSEQQRERDEWYRTKPSYEENFPRKEREDARIPNRYNGHDKDTGRHGERRDRLENEVGMQYPGNDDVHARGKQLGNDVKRSREEKPSARNERASVNRKVHEKHKDIGKGARESEGHGIPGPSKKHRGEKGVVSETGTSERADARHDTSVSNSARERRDASSDDEQNESKKGRSKLERWASHKDKSSSSSKVKEISRDKTAASIAEGESIKVRVKDVGISEGKAVDVHLDTFEKLKRRSERFKVPLTSEKDATVTMKKTEDATLPSSQDDIPPNPVVKPDRPPRKRRWISS